MSDKGDFLEQLILLGAVEVAGVDESGEFMYSFTPNIQEVAPDFYSYITNHYSSSIMELWANGFLEIDVDSDGEEIVRLNEKSLDHEAIAQLGDQERLTMAMILEAFDQSS